jgi:hypothetical protein
MYNWSYIQSKNKINFKRDNFIQNKYILDKIKVLKNYNSYEDFIKIKYLNSKPILLNKKYLASTPNLSSVLVLNKYPYNFEKNIKHYVLFSIEPLTKNESKRILSKLIKNKEFIVFINDTKSQSIKNLWHCHVFIKL